jgi:ankyrin repeat protein
MESKSISVHLPTLHRLVQGGNPSLLSTFDSTVFSISNAVGWVAAHIACKSDKLEMLNYIKAQHGSLESTSTGQWCGSCNPTLDPRISQPCTACDWDTRVGSYLIGTTPLMVAVRKSIKCTQLLLSSGVSANVVDSAGWSSAHYACFFDNIDTLTALHDNKSDLSILSTRELGDGEWYAGTSPLHVAIRRSPRCAKLLLGWGIKANTIDEKGWSPVHSAALLSRVDLLTLLSEHKAHMHT